MPYIREETVTRFPKDELLRFVKKNLDALGIPYEEKAGGFRTGKMIDPDILG